MRRKLNVCISTLSFVLLSGCASSPARITEQSIYDELRCGEPKEGSSSRCVRWRSEGQTIEEVSEQFGQAVAVLYNTGVLRTEQVQFLGRPDNESISEEFMSKYEFPKGAGPSLNIRVLNVICDMNRQMRGLRIRLGRPACSRPVERSELGDDPSSIISGAEISSAEKLTWGRASAFWVPELKIFHTLSVIKFENRGARTIREVLDANPIFCAGHEISVRQAEAADISLDANSRSCEQRYLEENEISTDSTDWEDADFRTWQLGFVIVDYTNYRELRRFPNAFLKEVRSISKPTVELLEEYSNGLAFEYEAGREGTTATISQGTYSFPLDGFDWYDSDLIAESQKENQIKYRRTAKCIEHMFDQSLLSKHGTFDDKQRQVFELTSHPVLSTNPFAQANIFKRLLYAASLSPPRTSHIGVLDRTPEGAGNFCEDPSSPDTATSCSLNLKGDRISLANIFHGVAVAGISSAGLSQITPDAPRESKGIIGFAPCSSVHNHQIDWNSTTSDEAGKPLTKLTARLEWMWREQLPNVWNISAMTPPVHELKGAPSGQVLENGKRLSDLMGVTNLARQHLFVVSGGHAKTGSGISRISEDSCGVFPACVSGVGEKESPNVIAVAGAMIENGALKVWSGDGLVSITGEVHDVFALASRVDENEEPSLYTSAIHITNDGFQDAIAPVEGVSFAVPQVAATAALMKQMYEGITPANIKNRIVGCANFNPELWQDSLSGLLHVECSLDGDLDRLEISHHAGDSTELLRGVFLGFYELQHGANSMNGISNDIYVDKATLTKIPGASESIRIQDLIAFSSHHNVAFDALYLRSSETSLVIRKEHLASSEIAGKHYAKFFDANENKIHCVRYSSIKSFVPALNGGAANLELVTGDDRATYISNKTTLIPNSERMCNGILR